MLLMWSRATSLTMWSPIGASCVMPWYGGKSTDRNHKTQNLKSKKEKNIRIESHKMTSHIFWDLSTPLNPVMVKLGSRAIKDSLITQNLHLNFRFELLQSIFLTQEIITSVKIFEKYSKSSSYSKCCNHSEFV